MLPRLRSRTTELVEPGRTGVRDGPRTIAVFMAILALGVSHRRATADLLERLAFGHEDLVEAYRRASDDPAIDEAVIVSTCNRVEIYGNVPSYHAGFRALKRLLCGSREVPPEEIDEPLYSHYELDAAEHLFGVASGLDSMVLGEPQILTQVRAAIRRARSKEAAGPALTSLFQGAARAGRRVRAETGVGAAPDAFIAAGAGVAAAVLGGMRDRRAVVVGAGQMSALAAEHLRRRGVGEIHVLNRSIERARVLAERVGAEHGGLGELPAAVASADLVVSATGAAGVVLTASTLQRALEGRTRPLVVLDLGLPRDVDPSARRLPRVSLVDIDDLRGMLEARAPEIAQDLERARAIVAEEVRRFDLRRRAERLAPVIRALRERGDRVVLAELERFRSDLAGLPPDERDAVMALARGVVAKLLHEPIVRLKELSGDASEDPYVRALVELFGLELPAA
jgi:glutamyl-tRNA reductase